MTVPPPRDAAAERIDMTAVLPILPALMDALSDGVVVLDRDRRLVAANRRYVEAFGMKRADAACAACPDARGAPAMEDGFTRCPACEAFDTGRPQRRLRQIADSSGAMRRYETIYSPVMGEDGRASHVVEVWRDITERSRLEIQLSHSERLASVGILAAGVAHEINNPLASMLACVETLARWLERGNFAAADLEEARETIELLEHEIERCRETTGKLRLLGRSYDASPGWVDLNAAVRDTLALLRYELRTRQLEAVEQLDAGLPKIWAREAGIRGICMNLTINAVQAMGSGGRLTVTTRHADDAVTLT